MESIDVIVVGAGPVGLLLAIELSLGGAQVLVLERLAAPSSITKALGMGPLGGEALQRRGMSAALAAAEAQSFAARQKSASQAPSSARDLPQQNKTRYSGHFGGLTLIRADAQKEPERRGRLVDQQAVEAMLNDRAIALGIEVRRGCEVKDLVQQADGVDVYCTSGQAESSTEGHIRCAYLVGCDGGRSPVRKLAGFAFPGTDPTLTMYTAVVDLDHPERLSGGWQRTSGGMYSYGMFPNRLFLMDFSGPPADRETPVTREEIEVVLRRVSCTDVGVKALDSGSRWTDNTRLVDTYRQGRVLLAGDAAHIHSPFGGQGMSLGLVDATNLGWKLASVLRREMPESLLDTYTSERRPVAEAVLANTLAQAAIMRPGPQSGAMRDLVAKLLELDDVNRFFGEMMSGLAIRYSVGLDGWDGPGSDLIGSLAGDMPLNHGSLYDLMQDGMGVLLDATTDGSASRLVAARNQRIRCVGIDAGPSILVRPDACIAWVGEENSTEGLEQALCRIKTPDLYP
jgi:2-polyprenyl-6-methoxyphenol hydroxylase-like FAD-dependent oxidoreductase